MERREDSSGLFIEIPLERKMKMFSLTSNRPFDSRKLFENRASSTKNNPFDFVVCDWWRRIWWCSSDSITRLLPKTLSTHKFDSRQSITGKCNVSLNFNRRISLSTFFFKNGKQLEKKIQSLAKIRVNLKMDPSVHLFTRDHLERTAIINYPLERPSNKHS